MERATVSLPQKMNNIYLRPGIGSTNNNQETLNNRNSGAAPIDDSAEISIFDAEKYFNELSVLEAPPTKPPAATKTGLGGGGGNRVTPAENIAAGNVTVGGLLETQRFSSASSSVDGGGYSSFYRNYRTRSFRSAATPTASSEASWNSQTGLLSVPPGSMAVSMARTTAHHEKKFTRSGSGAALSPPAAAPATLGWRLALRRKCPCSCKKSVQVKEKSVQPKPEIYSLPPPPPHVMLRSSSKSSSTTTTTTSTTTSSMADVRLTGNGINSTTISMDKVRHDSFQENWYQTRGSRSNSRDTRSFSSASTENMSIPPKLQAMGVRTSFADQRVGHGISTNNSTNASGFTFPILGVNPGIKLKDPANKSSACQVDEDPGRDSLEIFRPANEHFMRLDRGFPASPNSRAKSGNVVVDVIDDGASDASSDLFEIDSFSAAQTTTTATTTAHTPAAAMFLYRSREAMEEGGGPGGASGLRGGRFGASQGVMGLYEQHRRASLDQDPMTPSTECCYEPSEASIDWSVTTAEGFDRASVANASEADYGEFAETLPPPPPDKSRRRSSGNGLLMSCRCEKAVSIGRPVPRPAARPVGPASGGFGGENGRQVGPGVSMSSSSTLAMWAVGHKL